MRMTLQNLFDGFLVSSIFTMLAGRYSPYRLLPQKLWVA
jgi:hypothetical protein